jgi:uncharacterized protein YecE (DUF72 family)
VVHLEKSEKDKRAANPQDLATFHFRELHPDIFMGTTSDRYAGWLGQIYTRERYSGRITRRTNVVGGKKFIAEVLPVDSVEEYFDHFRVLEIDYTFYRLLTEPDGTPTQNYHVLRQYARYLQAGDRVILKVPQVICAQKLRRGKEYAPNRDFLNAGLFIRQFYEPALEVLGKALAGLIFEQEYQKAQDKLPEDQVAGLLDGFFEAVPRDSRYHVELRTESYLTPSVFEVFKKHGVGQVLSHWTWLPPLRRQFAKAGNEIFNSGREQLIRLVTPLQMRYEEAYAKAQPFDKLVAGMLQPKMIEETVQLLVLGIEKGVKVHVLTNNRSGGNAPLIAQMIAEEFLGHA